jgi:hypothetical protein
MAGVDHAASTNSAAFSFFTLCTVPDRLMVRSYPAGDPMVTALCQSHLPIPLDRLARHNDQGGGSLPTCFIIVAAP